MYAARLAVLSIFLSAHAYGDELIPPPQELETIKSQMEFVGLYGHRVGYDSDTQKEREVEDDQAGTMAVRMAIVPEANSKALNSFTVRIMAEVPAGDTTGDFFPSSFHYYDITLQYDPARKIYKGTSLRENFRVIAGEFYQVRHFEAAAFKKNGDYYFFYKLGGPYDDPENGIVNPDRNFKARLKKLPENSEYSELAPALFHEARIKGTNARGIYRVLKNNERLFNSYPIGLKMPQIDDLVGTYEQTKENCYTNYRVTGARKTTRKLPTLPDELHVKKTSPTSLSLSSLVDRNWRLDYEPHINGFFRYQKFVGSDGTDLMESFNRTPPSVLRKARITGRYFEDESGMFIYQTAEGGNFLTVYMAILDLHDPDLDDGNTFSPGNKVITMRGCYKRKGLE